MPSVTARHAGYRLLIVVFVLASVLLTALPTPKASAAGNTYFVSGNACAASATPIWSAGDTWILYGNTSVGPLCTLTIEPGATVRADPDVHLSVDGTLAADGTPLDPVVFEDNQTAGLAWAGIQFNPSSQGSVTWSNFTRVQVAVSARSSSPAINNNTILLASAGVYLNGSTSQVADNRIDSRGLGSYGIVVSGSDAALSRNRINGTTFGIQASAGGDLVLAGNALTNVSGATAIGVYLDNLTSATLTGNSIQTVVGQSGTMGGRGGTAVGILVNGTATVTLDGNAIDGVRGGRGGSGATSAVLAGSSGGTGGAAAGLALGTVGTASLQGNTAANITGGAGGAGGSSSVLSGGDGGGGGIAFAIEIFSSTGNVSYLGNRVANVTGGDGGAGGTGNTGSNGAGGNGADAYGIFSLGGLNASVSGNTIGALLGGAGGRSGATTSLAGIGGLGGNATAAIVLVSGQATIHDNTIDNLTGGLGGFAVSLGGAGGSATAVLAVGSGSPFNDTAASYNLVSNITGGDGGVGGKLSGAGGNASGVGGLHVDLSLASNAISLLQGGDGGAYAVGSNAASAGGSASGFLFFQVPDGGSSSDSVQEVFAGASGGTITGTPAQPGYGVGYYFLGDATDGTSATVANGTIATVGDYHLYVDNYSTVTTVNTPFASTKVAVMAAGNLTVRNFLTVRVRWPNNVTGLWGARVVVTDNGVEAYNVTKPFSATYNWILVTNRIYVDSPDPTWNTTRVSVSYSTSAFVNNPRIVNMTASQNQTFTMIDTSAPTSSVLALPAWTNTTTFPVVFTASDAFGVGVANVTLWYQLNGTGWTSYGTTSSLLLGFGQFSFTASSDGTYEFATTAVDNAGNGQQPAPPSANNTWTIVDTVAPATHVLPLPAYETSSTFTVSWAPDSGVTDVANYTVQVNPGTGWTDWLTNTTATSAVYTSTAQGPVAFRTVARDFADNLESKAGNDTWTVVDTVAPQVVAATPSGNLTVSPAGIQITFSEPMNQSAVEAALTISPTIVGTFTRSNRSTVLRFEPAQPFRNGTSYTVTVGTGATDLAGNRLAEPDTFRFSTPSPPPPAGLSLGDLWPLLVVVAAMLAGIAFFLVRRRGSAAPEVVAPPKPVPAPPAVPAKSEAAIDDIFLLYRADGVLIKHETRRLRPTIDSDILSGMLNAVQQFVKDSLLGSEGEELNEMVLGQMHILIGRGKWLILAATITGGDILSMSTQIQRCIQDMEDHHWDELEDWDGDMDLAKSLGSYLKKLIRGEYAQSPGAVTRAGSSAGP